MERKSSLSPFLRKLKRAIWRDEPTYYDMYENPGERFFARLYLNEIHQALQKEGLLPPLKVLDAGCQAGRLAIPLACLGHEITGVDTSGVGLRRAKRHAQKAGTSLRLIRADLGRWLPRQSPNSFDLVICAEVLYLRKNYRLLLEGLVRLLRPGGLCFISHRPTGYYMVEAFHRKDWDAVALLSTKREGTLWGSYYNWQERNELQELYPQLGIQVLSITPVGLITWLGVKPDDFDGEGQEALFQAELQLKLKVTGIGRYLLVCGRKR